MEYSLYSQQIKLMSEKNESIQGVPITQKMAKQRHATGLLWVAG